MWAAIQFIKTYWQLVTAGGGLIIVIIVLAWFTRSLWLALLAVGLIVWLGLRGYDFKQGYDRAWQEIVDAKNAIIAENEKTIADLKSEAEQQRLVDEAEIARLRGELEQTPPNDRPAIDEATAGRIGAFQ